MEYCFCLRKPEILSDGEEDELKVIDTACQKPIDAKVELIKALQHLSRARRVDLKEETDDVLRQCLVLLDTISISEL